MHSERTIFKIANEYSIIKPENFFSTGADTRFRFSAKFKKLHSQEIVSNIYDDEQVCKQEKWANGFSPI